MLLLSYAIFDDGGHPPVGGDIAEFRQFSSLIAMFPEGLVVPHLVGDEAVDLDDALYAIGKMFVVVVQRILNCSFQAWVEIAADGDGAVGDRVGDLQDLDLFALLRCEKGDEVIADARHVDCTLEDGLYACERG